MMDLEIRGRAATHYWKNGNYRRTFTEGFEALGIETITEGYEAVVPSVAIRSVSLSISPRWWSVTVVSGALIGLSSRCVVFSGSWGLGFVLRWLVRWGLVVWRLRDSVEGAVLGFCCCRGRQAASW
ncbi:hypothetical protein LR48_Vigan11g123400 [Vigna angularis]|uniref:Uncharacterized protein n=1 Tax=Phaseolus angularis TaxID=3914 RepID=A0A0L9VSZ7_PHAAN|nr:hypothetical protein LR48_Vigan11g123400 [Vigna angularis]